MRFTMDREFYLPRESQGLSNIETIEDSDAIVYTYEAAGKLGARGFHGKQAKPDWHFTFRTHEERAKHIADYFDGRKRRAAMMTERRSAPSATANRNRAIKQLLEAKYGYGNVSVTGSRGTAHGWVTVKINRTPRDRAQSREWEREVLNMITKAGIKLGHYYDEMDSSVTHAEIHIDFNRRAEQ